MLNGVVGTICRHNTASIFYFVSPSYNEWHFALDIHGPRSYRASWAIAPPIVWPDFGTASREANMTRVD